MNLPSRVFVCHHGRQIATLKVCDLITVTCDVTFFANSLTVAVCVDKNVAHLSSLIRRVSTRVFETRTANGREHFACQDSECLADFYINYL